MHEVTEMIWVSGCAGYLDSACQLLSGFIAPPPRQAPSATRSSASHTDSEDQNAARSACSYAVSVPAKSDQLWIRNKMNILTVMSLSAPHSREVMPETNAKRSETDSQARISDSLSLRMDIATRKRVCHTISLSIQLLASGHTLWPSMKNTSQTLKSVYIASAEPMSLLVPENLPRQADNP